MIRYHQRFSVHNKKICYSVGGDCCESKIGRLYREEYFSIV